MGWKRKIVEERIWEEEKMKIFKKIAKEEKKTMKRKILQEKKKKIAQEYKRKTMTKNDTPVIFLKKVNFMDFFNLWHRP